MPLAFSVGERVTLTGLNKRDDLNGASARVVQVPQSDADRYALHLDDTGECIRVRLANFVRAEPAKSNTSEPSTSVVDQTLFVTTTGQFTQPAMPMMPMSDSTGEVLNKVEGAYVFHTSLPAGCWEVLALESGRGGELVVTLVAVEREASSAKPAEWNELKGMRISRRARFADDADTVSTDTVATVEGNKLKVTVPLQRTARVDDEAPPPKGDTIASMDDKENADHENLTFNSACLGKSSSSEDEDVDVDGSEGEDQLEGELDLESAEAGLLDWEVRAKGQGRDPAREPLFVRRSEACGSAAPRRRSRKLAHARRRAEHSVQDRRRAEHLKPSADPHWKVEQARQHARQTAVAAPY